MPFHLPPSTAPYSVNVCTCRDWHPVHWFPKGPECSSWDGTHFFQWKSLVRLVHTNTLKIEILYWCLNHGPTAKKCSTGDQSLCRSSSIWTGLLTTGDVTRSHQECRTSFSILPHLLALNNFRERCLPLCPGIITPVRSPLFTPWGRAWLSCLKRWMDSGATAIHWPLN